MNRWPLVYRPSGGSVPGTPHGSRAFALLYLTTFKDGPSMRAWNGQDWAAMERLYKAGYIAVGLSSVAAVM
jgi:hypothetical protein